MNFTKIKTFKGLDYGRTQKTDNILKQVESLLMSMHSDIYTKLEAYENELKRRFGMSTATSPNLKQEIDLTQKPEIN